MGPSALRQQRFRERRKSGRLVLYVEVDETRLVELLRDRAPILLPPDNDPSQRELSAIVAA
jgi:hypothetical protein